MTQTATCFESVCDILRDCCGVSDDLDLRPELTLQGDLALDSIGLLNLVTELEEEYDFRLDEPLENPPQTLREIVDMVLARSGGSSDA